MTPSPSPLPRASSVLATVVVTRAVFVIIFVFPTYIFCSDLIIFIYFTLIMSENKKIKSSDDETDLVSTPPKNHLQISDKH